jgi:hypothetical protein
MNASTKQVTERRGKSTSDSGDELEGDDLGTKKIEKA